MEAARQEDPLRTHSARSRRAIVLLVAVAATPFIASPSATAQEVSVVDSAGDVWVYDEQTDDLVRAPDVADGDVVASHIQHRLRKVVIDTEYRELTPRGRHFSHVIMKSDGPHVYGIVLRVGPRNLDGNVKVFNYDGRDFRVECEASPRIDYEANATRVTVPRSCLSFPDWLRPMAYHYRMLDRTFALDTLGSRRAHPEGWVTPRIHRD